MNDLSIWGKVRDDFVLGDIRRELPDEESPGRDGLPQRITPGPGISDRQGL